jgi:hypothetical protein
MARIALPCSSWTAENAKRGAGFALSMGTLVAEELKAMACARERR